MAYIGRQLVRGQNRIYDDISSSFNGSTTAFNLTIGGDATPPAQVNQLWIILGGILQKPGTDFTVADAQVTFTTAPAAGLDFWAMIQGDTSDMNAPSDGSVTPTKIATSGDFSFPADVRFKDADGSHYVGLQAPTTVSSNLVWTLPAADGSANQYLKTNGSGVLGWASDTQSNLLDEDNMSSNSATQPASQQSIKAYVDAGDLSLIDEDNMSTDSATRPPSQQSVKAYADTKAVLTGSTNNTICTVTGAHAITGEAKLTFNGSGDLTVTGNEGTSANLYLIADEGDDSGDGWRVGSNQDANDLTFANNTSGSYVDKLTLLTNGNVTFAGTCTATSFSGGLPITSGADNRVITATSASAIQGESTLLFNGTYLHLNHANGGISWGTAAAGSFGTSPTIAIAEQNGYHSSGSLADDLVIGGKYQKNIIFGTSSGTSGGLTTRLKIDNGGDIIIGDTTSRTVTGDGLPLQVTGSGGYTGMSIIRTSAAGGQLQFAAGASGTDIADNNGLGYIKFFGYHTNGYDEYARIHAEVEGTPGDGDAPGAIVFSTTADGASSVTEELRILPSGGITFNGDTAVANALDDYEEGSFTPAWGGVTSASYNNQDGRYTKVGNLVTFSLYLRASAFTAGASAFHISGFPFSSIGSQPAGGAYWSYIHDIFDSGSIPPTMYFSVGGTTMFFYTGDGGGTINSNSSIVNDHTAGVHINGFYQVA